MGIRDDDNNKYKSINQGQRHQNHVKYGHMKQVRCTNDKCGMVFTGHTDQLPEGKNCPDCIKFGRDKIGKLLRT